MPFNSSNLKSIVVTRAKLIKALRCPSISRKQLISIVDRYMGDCPVPPQWSKAAVEGTFGKRVASLWARKISPLSIASFKSESGRTVFPVVQSIHEFKDLHKIRTVLDSKKKLMVIDEAWRILSPQPSQAQATLR